MKFSIENTFVDIPSVEKIAAAMGEKNGNELMKQVNKMNSPNHILGLK